MFSGVLILLGLLSADGPTLVDLDHVIEHFYRRPFVFDITEFPDKGDILWIKIDVTQDGRDDILVSGSKLITGPLNAVSWDVYKGEVKGGYTNLMYGMAFDPSEAILVEDEDGVSHLATLQPPFEGDKCLIQTLELVDDSTISQTALGVVATDTDEGRRWLAVHLEVAKGLVQVIPGDELSGKYAMAVADTHVGKPVESNMQPVAETGTDAAAPVALPSTSQTSRASAPTRPSDRAEAPATAPADPQRNSGAEIALGVLIVLVAGAAFAVFRKRAS